MEVPLKLGLLWVFLGLTTLLAPLLLAEEIKNCKPAAIVRQSRPIVYFQRKLNATLACIAKGDPTLKYTWLKNGEQFDVRAQGRGRRITMVPGVGSLMFSPVAEEDAGEYQCKVHNPCGTSLSIKTQLLQATISPFPRISEPETVKAILGRPLKLECQPPFSVPDATLSWVKESDEEYMDVYDDLAYDYEDEDMFNNVELGRRITMDYAGNLYFVAVEAEDSHKGLRYVCMATNIQVRSIVQGMDKFIEILGKSPANEATSLQWHSPEHELVLEGKKAKFKCIFSGNPTPEVRWRRVDGGPFDPERMVQSVDQHEFVISNVLHEDAGEYVCSGQNVLLREAIEQKFFLSVESRPRWTKRPEDMEVGVEDNVTVVCSVDSNPKASVEWYINGVPLTESPPDQNRRLLGNALVFTNVTQEDTQVIQCNASNIHGFLWADIFLQVQALAPSIVNMPTEQKVAKEKSITIPCQVEGKPRPQVLWYKGDQMLLGDNYRILPSGDLHIEMVDERDTGVYHCIAKNRFGQASAQGSLIVRDKTQIVTPPTNDRVSQGQAAIFTCGAVTAIEELIRLKFTWLKEGVPIDVNDPRVEVKKGTLMVKDTTSRDTGNYTCVASNSLDSDQASALLQVVAPPEPPTGVVLVACMDTQVHVEWEFEESGSNFSPLQEFIVEYSLESPRDTWQEARRVPAQTRQMSYTMSPWASYTFRVRARNHMGVSEPSLPTVTPCVSPEDRPYSNPSNVRTVEDKTGWLVIEWEPMSRMEHNSRDFRYVVTWRSRGREGEEGLIQSHVVRDWTQGRHSVQVGGVYQPYGITVEAANSVGKAISPAVEIIGHSGEAAPSVVPQNFELDPTKNVTSTTAAFRWDPVDTSPENINGNFRGYKIRCWKKNQRDTTLQEELIIIPEDRRLHRRAVNGDKIEAQVAGLPSFSDIEADVVVANTYFVSPGSNVINFTTAEGVPSRVKYVEALFRGSSHFLLEWGPPADANGHLTGYLLGYQKVAGLMVGGIVIARDDMPVGQQRTTLDGLEPNTLYRVFIAAKTAVGAGEKYFIDVRTADDTSELAEPRIQSVIAGEKEANVTFSLISEKGERTGSVYYLEYRKMGEHGWDRDEELATDHFWLTLEDLEPATTYEVRVVSVPRSASHDSVHFRPSQETRFDTSGIVNGTETKEEGTKKGSFLSAAWFIGMMVAIALLLLILIIVCIVKRNRGKAYTFPPEKDTVDGSAALFNEPPKNAKNGANTGIPLGPEGEKIPLGEETDSMVEFGDDPARFNEDGSFIGQYGDHKPPPPPDAPNPSAMSNIV
ncbi:neuroglian-like isoform X2 [Babylonia areolata]|uniref:neuroglian-like isoform X2 n=1 Tax=Babylonia areolata TaxID=304850 RepID=UPI003FD34CC6